MTDITQDKHYLSTLEEIKHKVKNAQIKAHFAVNREMLILYWQIGKTILEKQEAEGWGAKITRKLAEDLTIAFPQMKGFSYTNIRYMQRFAENYPDLLICQQVAGKLETPAFVQQTLTQIENSHFINDRLGIFLNIPWGHNMVILDKVTDSIQRLWYAKKTVENGWSRFVLITQIETNLYTRQGVIENKTNNFAITLPQEDSDLANEIFKDEYNFEFIDNADGLLKERGIENALVDNVIKFLLELGQGFAFVGKQYHLEVAGEDFYIDLLFYHIKLKSYIVIELKNTKFKPEYVGKVGFYLACVDDYIKDDKDNNSIGIILCKDDTANKEIKEKSLKCMIRPIGIASYKLAEKHELPKELESIKELERLM